MMFQEGPINGVIVRPLKRFEDNRGWLIELFRDDQIDGANRPAMAYVSETRSGVTRGPHEHRDQSDYFAFVGPGDFKLYLWDIRESSPTANCRQTLIVGESNHQAVIIPPGVVHAYKNISEHSGIMLNCPNRLYAGEGHREPVDEIRHEDQANSPFVLDDIAID